MNKELKGTYEERRAKERAVVATNTARIKKVLDLLGFSYGENADNYDARVLGKKEDYSIMLGADLYGHRGRLVVKGFFPRDKYGVDCTPYGLSAVEITISLSKSDEQIASEITKRFLPSYEAAMGKVREANRESEIAHDAREAIISRLGDLLKIAPRSRDNKYPSLHTYQWDKEYDGVNVTTNYDGDRVTLTLEVSATEAVHLAEFMRTVKQ